MPTQEQLLQEIDDRIGPGDGSTSDTLNYWAKAAATVLFEILNDPGFSFIVASGDLTPAPMPENSISDSIAVEGAKIITLQYSFSSTSAGTNSIFMEATIDGNTWVELASAGGLGDGGGTLIYNAGTTGGTYEFLRVRTETTFAGTTSLACRIQAIN